MRKATWGAILLGVFALTLGSPVRDVAVLHRVLSLSGLAAYLLLSYDPPVATPLQRRLLLAGVVCALVTFLLALAPLPAALSPVIRVLAVATVALPLWLVAGPVRYGFAAAGALALFTGLASGPYATSVHAYVAAACAFAVAALMHRPALLAMGERKPPRIVVASNIVTLTPEEKAEALARVERRFRDGEIPEHKYWDLRQEIESR